MKLTIDLELINPDKQLPPFEEDVFLFESHMKDRDGELVTKPPVTGRLMSLTKSGPHWNIKHDFRIVAWAKIPERSFARLNKYFQNHDR